MCSIVIILELVVSMSEFQTGFCTLHDEPTESGLYRLSIRGVVIAITASSVMLPILYMVTRTLRFMVHSLVQSRKGLRMIRMPLTTAAYNLDQSSQLSPPAAVWMLPTTRDKNNFRCAGGRKICIWRRSTDACALLALHAELDLTHQALYR